MCRVDKGMLLDLSKNLILSLTKDLNDEIANLAINDNPNTINEIITKCDGIITNIDSRFEQIKSLLSN